MNVRPSEFESRAPAFTRGHQNCEPSRRHGSTDQLRTKVLGRARGAKDSRWGMKRDELLELMQTLDDAWNKQDWQVFRQRHAEDMAVYWPGPPEPTRGRPKHQSEAKG